MIAVLEITDIQIFSLIVNTNYLINRTKFDNFKENDNKLFFTYK